MGPDLEANGYLLALPNRPTPKATTQSGRTYYRRGTLEPALEGWGEDDVLSQVQAGIPSEAVRQIGERHAALIVTPDPNGRSEARNPFDTALTMAAVEVLTRLELTGLGRSRGLGRRTGSGLPGSPGLQSGPW
jgi:hypothetical protein